MQKQPIQTTEIAISDLTPADYNPRIHDEKALAKLQESIKKFGFVDPVIANSAPGRKNIIIGGHMRLKAAQSIGMKTVPVIYLNIPDLKKEKELNLRLNRNTGEWDFEILKQFNVSLLLDVGFDDRDLSHIWDEQLSVEDDDFDFEESLAEIKTPKVKLGEIYQLGNNRLICGDATDPSAVAKLMGKDHASMLYFDPPYNIGLDYHKGVSSFGKYHGYQTQDEKSFVDYAIFIRQLLTNGLAHGTNDLHLFTWCDEKYIGLVQQLYRELEIENKRVCLWVKNAANMTPQIAFNKVYEPCVYGVRGKPFLNQSFANFHEILNKEIGTGNRLSDDILDLFNLWLVKRLPTQSYEHPTAKPPSLHEKALRRCTKPGDIILDLTAGSGSTLIAAEQMKRRAFLCELEPEFCDVIINRFQELTKLEAIRVN